MNSTANYIDQATGLPPLALPTTIDTLVVDETDGPYTNKPAFELAGAVQVMELQLINFAGAGHGNAGILVNFCSVLTTGGNLTEMDIVGSTGAMTLNSGALNTQIGELDGTIALTVEDSATLTLLAGTFTLTACTTNGAFMNFFNCEVTVSSGVMLADAEGSCVFTQCTIHAQSGATLNDTYDGCVIDFNGGTLTPGYFNPVGQTADTNITINSSTTFAGSGMTISMGDGVHWSIQHATLTIDATLSPGGVTDTSGVDYTLLFSNSRFLHPGWTPAGAIIPPTTPARRLSALGFSLAMPA